MGFSKTQIAILAFGLCSLLVPSAFADSEKAITRNLMKESKEIRKTQDKSSRAKPLRRKDAAALAAIQTSAGASLPDADPCSVADFNKDGIRDLSDISEFNKDFLSCYNLRVSCDSDLDGNGRVDNQDYFVFYLAQNIVHSGLERWSCSTPQ